MSEDQLKALQEEIAALRGRAKKRTFKQALKDAFKKLVKILNKEEEERSNQEAIVLFLFTLTSFAAVFAFLILLALVVIGTKGFVLLLIPTYVIYYLLKKD